MYRILTSKDTERAYGRSASVERHILKSLQLEDVMADKAEMAGLD